jgi:aryl-alcohol dehydrogenase-like predicted oxidoreductase
VTTSTTIEQRPLGPSGIEVSVVGLGGNTFGPPRLDEDQTRAVIAAALDLGVSFVDTAIVYGQGQSETFLARAMAGRRDEMVIATKCHFMNLGDETPAARIARQAEESLRKLETDRIDLYQVHFPSDAVSPDALLPALDALVRAGKVRAIGVCNYASWRLVQAAHVADAIGSASFATVQDYYHLLARTVEAEVAPACAAYGLSILPYHPLGGGFLTGKYRKGEPPPPGTRGAAGSGIVTAMSSDANYERLAALDAFATERGHTVGELAIAWLVANPLVASVIAGVSAPEQLVANVAAASWRLTPEEKAQVDELATGGPVPTPERPPYAGP